MLSALDEDLTARPAAKDGGATRCEAPESAASPPHQCFLKAYSQADPLPHPLLGSAGATTKKNLQLKSHCKLDHLDLIIKYF